MGDEGGGGGAVPTFTRSAPDSTISFVVYGAVHQRHLADCGRLLVALGSVTFASLRWYRRRHRS
ncbi:hypothetical protein [Deinococcus sp.]|uniref:hypothetical protein n=1 Tax=Deinococcus sp. TaxID=47478 RepID=UPI0025D1B388|nr:hypothetical protein [Deinococcus sp.]